LDAEKRERTLSTGRSPVGRIGVHPLFSTKLVPPGGSLAKERRQKVVGKLTAD
jgi:hypothetical protein